MNEPKPKQAGNDAEKPTEDDELTSEQLDDVSGGIIINGKNALASRATVAASLIDDPDGGGPLPP